MTGNSKNRILLSPADVSELEETYVLDALRSGWVAPLGSHVDGFERETAARTGVRAALALSSGTAALHLGLLGVGVTPGSTVLVPSMTFAASANAVTYLGAHPVFVDSTRTDGNVDPQLLLDAVDTLSREGVTISACMTVDLFGRCCDYPAVKEALARRGIPLVEDAAEALGARTDGGAAGSFGRVAALSFNGNKIITTSGGGMLLSDDAELVSRARYLATQARQPVPWYEHTEIGYNYRMSNVLAALGRAQLSRLDAMMERRRQVRRHYRDALSDIPWVRFLGDPDDPADNCWLTCVELCLDDVDVDTVLSGLGDVGIEARHLWKPMHLQPVFAGERAFLTGHSEALFRRGLALPSGSTLTDGDVERVVTSLRRTLARLGHPVPDAPAA